MDSIAADEKAHDEDVRAMEGLLGVYRSEARPERRESQWARYSSLRERADMLCDREQEHIEAVDIGALSRALKPGPEAAAFADAVTRIVPLRNEHSRLCRLNDKLRTDFKSARENPPAPGAPAPIVIKDAAELARMMETVTEDAAAIAADAGQMASLLAQFRAAPPEAREPLAIRIGVLISDADDRCGREWRIIDAVKLAALSRSMGPRDAAAPFAQAVARLAVVGPPLERDCRTKERLKAEFFTENAAGGAARAAPGAGPSPLRRRAAAGAAAVLALAAWGFLRRRRAPPAPALEAPGDFTVGRLLGQGSLGETYEGFDKTLRRKVALKRLRPELLATPADAQRLSAGARAAAAISHAGLVALHTLCRQGGQSYLVFEYVDGPALSALLARSGTLGFEQALRVLASVAEGLEAAHAAGMPHGDVRPADILVAASGAPKLKGLGFASVARGTLARVSRLESPGRFDYMAPEREIGAPDPASDTYALAACFYQMLTGRPPFSGDGALADKRAGRFTPPRSLAPALPAGMDMFFQTALAADPAARFASPRALASAAGALR